VSDPYRSSGGTPCPRCKQPLRRESDDQLECSNGCGSWLGNGLIKTLLDPASLVKSKGNPFKATPLPPSKCLVCKKPLNDLYMGTVDVLTLGQCVVHGVWLEHADRAMFEALYAPEIARQRAERARKDELARVADEVDPVVARLMQRVDALEAQVRALQDELASIRVWRHRSEGPPSE
jgi:hypothetical protein